MIVYGAFMSASGFWTDKEMKATFTAFFGTLMLYRLGSLTYTGAVTTPLMIEAAVAVPMVFRRRAGGLGAWIGVYIFDHIPERIFQWVVLALLTVNAFVLPVHGDSGTLTAFSRLRTAVSVPLDTAVVAKTASQRC